MKHLDKPQPRVQIQEKEMLHDDFHDEKRPQKDLSLKYEFHDFPNMRDCDTNQAGYLNGLHKSPWIPTAKSNNASAKSHLHESESLEKLFMDFTSLRIIREDEDSASDLSDSERIPMPPSPFTPPGPIFRAEEILEPGCFSDINPDCNKFQYPNFLPPPFNSWNLPKLATLINTEEKNSLRTTPSGSLEKYVDRLLQLEWLQMQTVEAEKSKAAKARLGIPHNGKTQKSKSQQTSISGKQINISKGNHGQENHPHRKTFHTEERALKHSRKLSTKVSDETAGCFSAQKQTLEGKCVTKRRTAANYSQTINIKSSDCNPKTQSIANIRPPKQILLIHGQQGTEKPKNSTIHSSQKMNGTLANNPMAIKQPSAEPKLHSAKVSPWKVK
ncbi:protein FAM217B isoform X2 [Xenopus laevis]|nr:protein FAM217B isoform X2 [Xenopus laevis]XP_041434098.1 protein FAM217B isoform X2 [Xenopus laevis]